MLVMVAEKGLDKSPVLRKASAINLLRIHWRAGHSFVKVAEIKQEENS
jgi:hypothetical protein